MAVALILPIRAANTTRPQSMSHRTPFCVMAKRLLRKALDALDRKVFLDVDLDATARGWRVNRPRPFVRAYRDPRWDRAIPRDVAAESASASVEGAICPHHVPGRPS